MGGGEGRGWWKVYSKPQPFLSHLIFISREPKFDCNELKTKVKDEWAERKNGWRLKWIIIINN